MRMRALALALLAGTAFSGPGLALEPSGTTVKVDPDAEANGATGLRIVEVKGPIYMGDVITTDIHGKVQIEFVDETKFVVGANSKVTIDAFVFDANKTAQEVSITAVKGAFRFITGKSPKDHYTIRTPTMTIGVRGTAFDLAVRAGSGESMLYVHEGSTDVCDILNRADCMEGNSGNMVMSSGGGSGLQSVDSQMDQLQRLSTYFPLMQSQTGLAPGFVVPILKSLRFGETNETIHNEPSTPAVQPDPPDGRPPSN